MIFSLVVSYLAMVCFVALIVRQRKYTRGLERQNTILKSRLSISEQAVHDARRGRIQSTIHQTNRFRRVQYQLTKVYSVLEMVLDDHAAMEDEYKSFKEFYTT